MTDDVERVARAICDELAHQDGYEGEGLWPLDADGTIAYLDQTNPNMLAVARAAITALSPDQRIADAVAALEPFARWAEQLGGQSDDSIQYASLRLTTGQHVRITAGDLRRAAAIRNQPEREG